MLDATWRLTNDGTFGHHVGASLTRSVVGFGIAVVAVVAVVAGVTLGLLIGWYRFLADLLTPVLEILRNTAALALLPVVTLLLGIGETAKISLVVYADCSRSCSTRSPEYVPWTRCSCAPPGR